MAQSGWVGFDLDGTLCVDLSHDNHRIGPPIKPMVELVKRWLSEGTQVKIVTSRVSWDMPVDYVVQQRMLIQCWCCDHIGECLEVVFGKDTAMIRLYDNQATQVETNTGRIIGESYPYPQEVDMATEWGLHPEEALPRSLTWLHERRNWDNQVLRLRAKLTESDALLVESTKQAWKLQSELDDLKKAQEQSKEAAVKTPKRLDFDTFVELIKHSDWIVTDLPGIIENIPLMGTYSAADRMTNKIYIDGPRKANGYHYSFRADNILFIQRGIDIIYQRPDHL